MLTPKVLHDRKELAVNQGVTTKFKQTPRLPIRLHILTVEFSFKINTNNLWSLEYFNAVLVLLSPSSISFPQLTATLAHKTKNIFCCLNVDELTCLKSNLHLVTTSTILLFHSNAKTSASLLNAINVLGCLNYFFTATD